MGSFSISRRQSLGTAGGGAWNFDATHCASIIAGAGSPADFGSALGGADALGSGVAARSQAATTNRRIAPSEACARMCLNTVTDRAYQNPAMKWPNAQVAGAVNANASARSKTPPCPGRMPPLSFTPLLRLSTDINRSPA